MSTFFFLRRTFSGAAPVSARAVSTLGRHHYGGGSKGRCPGTIAGAPTRMSARGGSGVRRRAGVSQSSPSAAVAAARWAAVLSKHHQRWAHPAAAVARREGGARSRRSAVSAMLSGCHRPPSSAPRTSRRWGPAATSSQRRRWKEILLEAPLPCASTQAETEEEHRGHRPRRRPCVGFDFGLKGFAIRGVQDHGDHVAHAL